MSYQKKLLPIIITVALFSVVGAVNAQLKPWDASNQVMVDLSVLNDNGSGPTPRGMVAPPSLTGNLLAPPSSMPVSRLFAKRESTAGSNSYRYLQPVTLKNPSKTSRKSRAVHSSVKKLRSRAPRTAALNALKRKSSVTAPIPAIKLAPVPKARPTPPVIIAKAPPPPAIRRPASTTAKKLDSKAAQERPGKKLASLASTSKKTANNQLIFTQGNAKLTVDAEKFLNTMAKKLNAEPTSRMQLLAYAGELNLSASKARRLSLSRALSIRSYLIKKGVRSTRIDVRALGNKVASGAPNRVDLKFVSN